MSKGSMSRFRDQRGVAMITVLFIGAALTIVSSTAAFVTIQELRSSTDDRKASAALSYAEAGVDRLLLEMRRGSFDWGDIRLAGCDATHPAVRIQGTIGNGSFDSSLTVYNPNGATAADRLPPAACVGRSTSPKEEAFFAITSTGRHPAARRVVRQQLSIQPLGLPIGVFADRVDGNGTPVMLSISLVSPGNVVGRDKIGFTGNDPWYKLGDFYPGLSTTTPIPAAVHAAGTVFDKGSSEHPPSPNCGANTRGTNGQSVWDGSGSGAPLSSGCPAWGPTFPPTARFTSTDLNRVSPRPSLSEQDYMTLREAAKTSGLYCTPSGGNFSCLRQGTATTITGTVQPGDMGGLVNVGSFVAYFDFPSGGNPFSNSNTVKFKAAIGPCSDDPAANRGVVLIIRNGSLSMQSGAVVTGAIILPEGRFDSEGNFTTHGTIIAKEFWLRGGATFEMSECWIRNMPAPFLDVTTGRWNEVDR
jgi:hypothetical protein